MSRMARKSLAAKQEFQAVVFAALGDRTRLSLVAKLSEGQPCSIAQLTDDTHLTRQAVTKHLRVLENAGLVQGTRIGREIKFELIPVPLEEMKAYLENISMQWDSALSRLKRFVER
jgi:DNA-binding transcriptional ArsR family regulator